MNGHHRHHPRYRMLAPVRSRGFPEVREARSVWPPHIELVSYFKHVGDREDLVERLSKTASGLLVVRATFGGSHQTNDEDGVALHRPIRNVSGINALHDALVASIDSGADCQFENEMALGSGYSPLLARHGKRRRCSVVIGEVLLTDTDPKHREHVVAHLALSSCLEHAAGDL